MRGRSLGTKLSEAEYAQCEKSAARRGQTLSEWCRQALLDAVAGPAPRPEAEVTSLKILALRKILINLLYKAGEPMCDFDKPSVGILERLPCRLLGFGSVQLIWEYPPSK